MTLLDDQPWRLHAACRDVPTAAFFGEKGVTAAETNEVRQFCRACPVREECLAYAVADPDIYGIWGGLTLKERKQLRRTQRYASA